MFNVTYQRSGTESLLQSYLPETMLGLDKYAHFQLILCVASLRLL